MKNQIVAVDNFGVFAMKGVPFVNSRKVAEVFNKRHDNVLQAIANCECSEEFRLLNFKESFYKNEQNKNQPEVSMTKDGFAFIVMGFTGKRAARFKEAYIKRFNEMEQFIESRSIARLESRELTDAVQLLHDPPKHYHYSNEFDMINRIVLGMSSKKYRLQNGIPKDEPLRDYLSLQEINAIQKLQAFDAHLAKIMPDYRQRQVLLQKYYAKTQEQNLCLTGT